MENLWKIAIASNEIKSPKSIFEEQSKYLSQMTNNIIYLDVSEYKDNLTSMFEKIQPDYKLNSTYINYQVNVKSVLLEKYGFSILTYKHDIPFYPVKISLNPDICKEIYGSDDVAEKIAIGSEDEFVEFVGKILSTNKIEMVINSMLSLSK